MSQRQQGVYRIDGYVIDVDRRLILTAGKEVKVQPRVFDVLIYLLDNRERAVSKEELQEGVWPGQFISETVMSRAVMKARKAVGDDAHKQSVIKTLHGYGYRFVANTEFIEQAHIEETDSASEQTHHSFDSRPSRQRFVSLFSISSRNAVLVILVLATTVIWLARDKLHILDDTLPSDTTLPRVSANQWPDAEALFQHDSSWLGGTLGPSVDLGGGRIAWFFGNSYVSEQAGQNRRDASYISNAVGIQRGYFPPTSTLEVFWQVDKSGPASFFAEKDGKWYWPLQATMIDRGLILFLAELRKTSEGLGFEPTSVDVMIVENHADSPDRWIFRLLQLTEADAGMIINISSLYSEGDYLYSFSRQKPVGDAYLARWLKESVGFEDKLVSEWWCGEELGWLVLGNDLSRARPVINDASHQFHIHFQPLQDRYILIEGWGFPSQVIDVRSAEKLTGSWSDRTIIFRPVESHRRNVFAHNIGVHPGLQGADVIATYDVNHEIFSQASWDTTVLYPRFVRINFETPR